MVWSEIGLAVVSVIALLLFYYGASMDAASEKASAALVGAQQQLAEREAKYEAAMQEVRLKKGEIDHIRSCRCQAVEQRDCALKAIEKLMDHLERVNEFSAPPFRQAISPRHAIDGGLWGQYLGLREGLGDHFDVWMSDWEAAEVNEKAVA